MKILVSGASGVLGSALVPELERAGHEVRRLVRSKRDASANAVFWEPGRGEFDPAHLRGVDAVIHLSGESIAGDRWSRSKKQRIEMSRVSSTTLLSNAMVSSDRRPAVFLCASAVGYYGNSGEKTVDESAPQGEGFLGEVCHAWEEATNPARDAGVRVVNMRSGVVLTPKGGALRTMLTPFRLGVGGPVGSGEQYVSWIALDDEVGAIRHLLDADVSGPLNVVSPNPVTNKVFSRALGRVLNRPTVLTVPAAAVRLALGEMADELLLFSQRASADKLLATGYEFKLPEIEGALQSLLK